MESPSALIQSVCAFDDPGTEFGFSIAGGILDAMKDSNDNTQVDDHQDKVTKIQKMYESMKVIELRAACALLGVEFRRLKKRALIALLLEHCKAGWATEYLSSLTVAELRKECTHLGVSTSGCLLELVGRIVTTLKSIDEMENKDDTHYKDLRLIQMNRRRNRPCYHCPSRFKFSDK